MSIQVQHLFLNLDSVSTVPRSGGSGKSGRTDVLLVHREDCC